MDIVSLNYLDFLNGQNQNLKRSCFSKFVFSDYSSEENDLSKDMLNFKIKRHLAWTNCVCFIYIATLSFFSNFRKSIVLSANPVNRADNYEIPMHKRLLFRIKV